MIRVESNIWVKFRYRVILIIFKVWCEGDGDGEFDGEGGGDGIQRGLMRVCGNGGDWWTLVYWRMGER